MSLSREASRITRGWCRSYFDAASIAVASGPVGFFRAAASSSTSDLARRNLFGFATAPGLGEKSNSVMYGLGWYWCFTAHHCSSLRCVCALLSVTSRFGQSSIGASTGSSPSRRARPGCALTCALPSVAVTASCWLTPLPRIALRDSRSAAASRSALDGLTTMPGAATGACDRVKWAIVARFSGSHGHAVRHAAGLPLNFVLRFGCAALTAAASARSRSLRL